MALVSDRFARWRIGGRGSSSQQVVAISDTSKLVQSSGHDSKSMTGALKIYAGMIRRSDNLEKSSEYGSLVEEIAGQLEDTLNLVVSNSSDSGGRVRGTIRVADRVPSRTSAVSRRVIWAIAIDEVTGGAAAIRTSAVVKAGADQAPGRSAR